ncbi:FtsX-like permease family protein, partial [Bacillus licheniformis]
MTFRQFAFNNVIRNKRLYAAYFLSSMFTVMVFFAFAIFAFHPVMTSDSLTSGIGQHVSIGLLVSSGIIFVFSFFFVLYSMSSFLQSRKKEFGVLMIQGMSMRQIRMMVFLENMLIGLFATIGGIVLGLVFAKLILLTAENVLII